MASLTSMVPLPTVTSLSRQRTANVCVGAEFAQTRSWGCTSLALSSVEANSFAETSPPSSFGASVEAPWVMAVPKKHKSRMKTRIARAVWKMQARAEALKALSLAKSVLTGRSKSFIYVQNEKPSKDGDEEGPEATATGSEN